MSTTMETIELSIQTLSGSMRLCFKINLQPKFHLFQLIKAAPICKVISRKNKVRAARWPEKLWFIDYFFSVLSVNICYDTWESLRPSFRNWIRSWKFGNWRSCCSCSLSCRCRCRCNCSTIWTIPGLFFRLFRVLPGTRTVYWGIVY